VHTGASTVMRKYSGKPGKFSIKGMVNFHMARSVKCHHTVDSDGPYCCLCSLWSKSTEGVVWLCCTGEHISGRHLLWVQFRWTRQNDSSEVI